MLGTNNAPLIRIDNLTKTYGDGQKWVEALKGITLDIGEKEFISIMGASGAGKSTLLHILGTLDRPTSGRVFYRGEDVYAWGNRQLARFRNEKIGFVFQSHHLLPELTALENIMMPARIRGMKKGLSIEKAETILEKVGLQERRLHKPGELSGGEQQRVALARALILNPEIIFADEPTGNLDSVTGGLIFDLLLEFNEGENIAVVIVTHNQILASRTPRCLVLHDGRLLKDTSSTQTTS